MQAKPEQYSCTVRNIRAAMCLGFFIWKERNYMQTLFNRFMNQMNKLGKAMLLPIVALPLAGLLMCISEPYLLNMPVLKNVSSVIFGNIDLLFTVGAISAFVKNKDKTSAIIAGVLSLMIFKNTMTYFNPDVNMGVFAGIVIGTFTAFIFNKSSLWHTPDMFAFFTGDKFVITLAPLAALILGSIFASVWPPIQNVLNSFAIWLGAAGAIGIFLYGVLNRLLIPIGLHHVLNAYIFYEIGSYTTTNGEIVKGEIARFMAGDPTAGLFLSMFFVVTMFGLPAACLAMYRTAKKEHKNEIKGIMTANGLTSFVTGVTEPVEFSFMFVGPKLFVAHAILTGLSGVALYYLNVKEGLTFGFSFIDFVVLFQQASNPVMIIVIGVPVAILYYVIFKYLIIRDDVKTPGREDDILLTEEISDEEKNIHLEHSNYRYMAKKILDNIGGRDNIVEIENCITRLRVEVKNGKLVNDDNIKKTGAKGVVHLSDTSIQIVIGTDVKRIMKHINELMEED